jgi:hypothetical protein
MPDEEFNVLGEEDLALLSRRFERMYTNRKNTQRNSGMCYQCGKHKHFIAECPEAMEVNPEHKHRSRINHKHRSRDDYKSKNKSERRPRKSGGHKKKERAMVAGASDIDTKASGRARTSTACASPPKDFAAWHIAPQARRATRMTRAPTQRKR